MTTKDGSVSQSANGLVKRCRVCGDSALGFNFSGLSCESCKAFFRRSALTQKQFKCRKGNNCVITKLSRKSCKQCRLEKCFLIGMRMDLVSLTKNEHQEKKLVGSAENLCTDVVRLKVYDFERLNEVQRAMRIFQDENTMQLLGQARDAFQILNINKFYISSTIKYCKTFECFRELQQEDQIILLKGFHQEMGAIRAAFVYDVKNDGLPVYADDTGKNAIFVKLDCSELMHFSYFVKAFRQYITNMKNELMSDPAIRDLLMVQILFKPRSGITCDEYMRYNHCLYQTLLRRYLVQKFHGNIEKAERKYIALMEMLDNINQVAGLFRQVYLHEAKSGIAQIITEIYAT